MTLWDVTSQKLTPISSKFQCHSRAISSIDWCHSNPNILASSSNDSDISIWDVRTAEKPHKLRSWTPIINGAIKVLWNRKQSEHILASSVNSQLLIWDVRKTSIPMSLIMADTKPILDFDWSYDKSSQILTATGSNVLKIWSLLHPKTPTATIVESKPIVRGCFTPFGRGVVTVPSVPTHGWKLYAISENKTPVLANEFGSDDADNYQWTQLAWRKCLVSGFYEHQLLSWNGQSESLKLWKMHHEDYTKCQYIHSLKCKEMTTDKPPSHRSKLTSSSIKQTVNHEISSMVTPSYVSDLSFDVKTSILTAHVNRIHHPVQIKMVFPNMYPNRAMPQLTLTSSMPTKYLYEMRKELLAMVEERVSQSKNCVLNILDFIYNHKTPDTLDNPEQIETDGIDVVDYVTKPSDTLASIALTHNMTLTEIKKLNNIQHSIHLYPGKIIKVKASDNLSDGLRASGIHGKFLPSKKSKYPSLSSSKTVETLPDYYGIPCTYIGLTRNVKGVLAMTSTLLIFEPDDKNGDTLRSSLSYEMSSVKSVHLIKPDPSYEVKFEVIIEENHEKSKHLFTSEKSYAEHFCKKSESLIETKKASSLLENLNIDTIPVSSSFQREKLSEDFAPQIKLKSSSRNVKPMVTITEDDDSDEDMARLLSPSSTIDEYFIQLITPSLPYVHRDAKFNLIFSTRLHGTSLNTLYRLCKGHSTTILVVKDSTGCIFGGFSTEPWNSVSSTFFGSGESFLFSYKPNFCVYSWTRANRYFQLATKKYLAMGGGLGGYGLWLDDELFHGASDVSNTFLNRKLSQSNVFECKVLEVWSLE